jgi:hypothetical protein
MVKLEDAARGALARGWWRAAVTEGSFLLWRETPAVELSRAIHWRIQLRLEVGQCMRLYARRLRRVRAMLWSTGRLRQQVV